MERPRSQRTSVNSATSMRIRAMQPIPSRHDSVGGTASLLTIHRAAKIVIASMTGVSKSSAILVPSRGATPSTRMGPRMNPTAKTRAKWSTPAFRICITVRPLPARSLTLMPPRRKHLWHTIQDRNVCNLDLIWTTKNERPHRRSCRFLILLAGALPEES